MIAKNLFRAILVLLCAPAVAWAQGYDVVVYGGTAGGAIAAIAAADAGMRTALVEPRANIGGMVSGGLGQTDFGNESVIGGYSRQFFQRIGAEYGEKIAWHFEPHVAERVFRTWLQEAGVEVYFAARAEQVRIEEGRITELTLVNGDRFTGKIFIDASYEGDLLPLAGIACTWGREAASEYGESLAGQMEHSPNHQFFVPINPYDEDGLLIPGVEPALTTPPGSGDKKVQSYNFRMCLTDDPENRLPIEAPAGYDPGAYELLRRYLEAVPGLTMNELMIMSPMPNRKLDINNRGPVSTNLIGGSRGYPDANYAEQRRIWDAHRHYVQGFFYFLGNDPSVPAALRNEVLQWGLPKDEYPDNGHWSHQIYIREARRMIGATVMTQRDLQTERTKAGTIGMGSYNSDSHHVQRVVAPVDRYWPNGPVGVVNEGNMEVPVRLYEIPYGCITPKARECVNLLAPVCMSASHVAYSSMRMEPQYMILGQAAGFAAAQAIRRACTVQAVDVPQLQEALRATGAVLTLAGRQPPELDPRTMEGVVLDDQQALLTGRWQDSSSVKPFVGFGYAHEVEPGREGNVAEFKAELPAGRYEVGIAWPANPNRTAHARVTILHGSQSQEAAMDMRQAPEGGALFAPVARLTVEGGAAMVRVENAGSGYLVVDAVRWLPISAETGRPK
ncbi:MAG: FAD-dependent oxidoreductase [Candidatus Hydrogenedentes bacterium]|nr:FAD-dependent oxidoreductase [Candidatus Hydrogenedentota bacterium]